MKLKKNKYGEPIIKIEFETVRVPKQLLESVGHVYMNKGYFSSKNDMVRHILINFVEHPIKLEVK